MKRSVILCLCAIATASARPLTLPTGVARGCTTILVGRSATTDGSVLMATSCDGGIMGRVYVLPAREYPPGTKIAMFYDFPAPSTWQEHLDQVRKGDTQVGELPVE